MVLDDTIQVDWTERRRYHETIFPPMALSHHRTTEDGSLSSASRATKTEGIDDPMGFGKLLIQDNNNNIEKGGLPQPKSRMERYYRTEDSLGDEALPWPSNTLGNSIDHGYLNHGEEDQEPGWKFRLVKSRSKRVRTVPSSSFDSNALPRKRSFEPLVWHDAAQRSFPQSSPSSNDATEEISESEEASSNTVGSHTAYESQTSFDHDRELHARWLSSLPSNLVAEIEGRDSVDLGVSSNNIDSDIDANTDIDSDGDTIVESRFKEEKPSVTDMQHRLVKAERGKRQAELALSNALLFLVSNRRHGSFESTAVYGRNGLYTLW
ncbi:hypothetical protein BGX31_009999 [Mortierella sp. GBA43]|nr:hypothetical protein BGX31_009999 [Mortierella sp. GBA43]